MGVKCLLKDGKITLTEKVKYTETALLKSPMLHENGKFFSMVQNKGGKAISVQIKSHFLVYHCIILVQFFLNYIWNKLFFSYLTISLWLKIMPNFRESELGRIQIEVTLLCLRENIASVSILLYKVKRNPSTNNNVDFKISTYKSEKPLKILPWKK